MRAMNALGRQLYLLNAWAASGVGITGVLAAFFVSFISLGRASPYNNYYDLRNPPESQYS